jgi:uncharacterized protein YpmS
MSRRTRLSLIAAVALIALIVAVLLGLYFAAQKEPAFYRDALEIKQPVLDDANGRMLKKIGSLQSAVTQPGHWHSVITAEEINGWLAVDLHKNHPKLLPPSVYSPRVAITPNEMSVACRCRWQGVDTVLSLTFQPYVSEQSVIALRIIRGRAGIVPVPLKGVLDGISKGAADMQLRLIWAQDGSDPVALITLPDDDERIVRIESIELKKGEIHVWGVTERRKK